MAELIARTELDGGLRLERVWEEAHGGRRILLAEYVDERRPEVLLGLWWDVDRDPGWHFDTDDEVAGT